MNCSKIPDPEVLKKIPTLFTYSDGRLFWNHSRGNVKAGSLIDYRDNRGHIRVRIFDRLFRAHHVIWFLHYGKWPSLIDHINGDPADNRIENLRECTQQENTRNRSSQPSSRCSYKGVSYHTRGRKWVAQIKSGNVRKHLGLFAEIEDAATAYNFAAAEMHGQYAFYNLTKQPWLDGDDNAL
jgi:hypothetical protein